MKKFLLFVGFVLVAGGILLYLLVGNPTVFANNKRFGDTMRSRQSGQIAMNDLIPFRWDFAYVFDSYASKEEIETAIGFSSSAISAIGDESVQEIVFVKGQKVVCCISNRPHNTGYKLQLMDSGKNYQMAAYSDNALLNVELIEKTLYYNQDTSHIKPKDDPNIL